MQKAMREITHGLTNSSLPPAALPASGLRGLQHFFGKIPDSQPMAPPLSVQDRTRGWEVNAAESARRFRTDRPIACLAAILSFARRRRPLPLSYRCERLPAIS